MLGAPHEISVTRLLSMRDDVFASIQVGMSIPKLATKSCVEIAETLANSSSLLTEFQDIFKD